MPSRRKAREYALQMLFQWDIGKDSPETVMKLFWENRKREPWNPEDEPVRSFASELFRGTVDAAAQLDALIRQHTEHWRLERMPTVDRNILRLGIYELLHRHDTPPVVVINEALEIAHKFSDEEAAAFINGLLDRIRKEAESVHPT